jgi:hypothetical protein
MPPCDPEQTVYSYFVPEVRDLVRDVLVHDADDLIETLRQNVDPGLDNAHVRAMDAFEDHLLRHGINGINQLRGNRYPVNGSSEALFHLIAQYVASDPLGLGRIWTLEGEYQGFEAYANSLGAATSTVTEEMVLTGDYPSGLFLVSNPSSRDGNYLREEVLKSIIRKPGNQVVVDLAYVGMASPVAMDLNHPNVKAVVASMSKPWGLYYFRIGFAWTRHPTPSLYGNKWFKNLQSLRIAEAVLNYLPADLVREKYRPIQHEILDYYQEPYRDIAPSDVWLLAYEDDGPQEYVRAGTRARYCLTPKFMEWEDA